jgi:hypothetical protein
MTAVRRGAGLPGWRRRGLVVVHRPSGFGWPRGTLEQERERTGAPPSHFVEAQAEQELWQELRDHGASLNRALNEALQIHSGRAWRVFQVSGLSSGLVSFAFFHVRAFPDPFSSRLAYRRQDLER